MTARMVKGFEVRMDRSYNLTSHIWVLVGDELCRIGMDSLGLETSGTLAHISFGEVGISLAVGDPFGSLEAEKYVGPLVSPLSGVVRAVNNAAAENPGLVQDEPYDAGWMIEVEPTDLDADLLQLVSGEDAIAEAFSKKVTEYRLEGVLAE